jgi:hypothetical protein
MKLKSLLALVSSFVAAIFLNGCAAVVVGGAAGVGTYAYINGELKVDENASLDRCFAATQAAMKDLEFTVTSTKKDALESRVEAKTALGTKIEVNLKKTSDVLTEVKIRVGTFGDKAMSQTILQKIEKHL